MTPIKLSYNTMMTCRVLAMTSGLPIYSDPGLREDTFCLVAISDILEAANCSNDVATEMEKTDILNEWSVRLSPEDCTEALKWVLEHTNPKRVLRFLAYNHTFYFMTDEERLDSMFRGGRLDFFMEHCKRLSLLQRLHLVEEALWLADLTVEKDLGGKAMPDLLRFCKTLLYRIKLPDESPAKSRLNLLWAGVATMLWELDVDIPLHLRKMRFRDLELGVKEVIRKIALG